MLADRIITFRETVGQENFVAGKSRLVAACIANRLAKLRALARRCGDHEQEVVDLSIYLPSGIN